MSPSYIWPKLTHAAVARSFAIAKLLVHPMWTWVARQHYCGSLFE